MGGLGANLGGLAAKLGRSWGHISTRVGKVLGLSWRLLGPSWRLSGSTWRVLDANSISIVVVVTIGLQRKKKCQHSLYVNMMLMLISLRQLMFMSLTCKFICEFAML